MKHYHPEIGDMEAQGEKFENSKEKKGPW